MRTRSTRKIANDSAGGGNSDNSSTSDRKSIASTGKMIRLQKTIACADVNNYNKSSKPMNMKYFSSKKKPFICFRTGDSNRHGQSFRQVLK